MKSRLEEKYKAIELRKRGLSYKEIQKIVPASKSLLSGWFKYLSLTENELDFLKSRILERQNIGRINAALSNRNRRIEREVKNLELSRKSFEVYKNDPIFIIGVSLYWAEGSKRTGNFQFINSDGEMILFIYKWIQKYLQIDKTNIKCRLFTHKIQGYEQNIDYWSNILELDKNKFQKTIFKPTAHSVKKNPNYNGCLRIELGKIDHLRTMTNWRKLLYENYGNLLLRS